MWRKVGGDSEKLCSSDIKSVIRGFSITEHKKKQVRSLSAVIENVSQEDFEQWLPLYVKGELGLLLYVTLCPPQTRSRNSGSCVGVDPNRNWGYEWGGKVSTELD